MPQVTVSLINDMTPEVLAAMKEQVEKGLIAIGSEAEGYAKDDAPVDTGRLRNSICWATSTEHASGDGRDQPLATPEEGTVYIGTNVEYAESQEYGEYKHKVGRPHFLRDAATGHDAYYKGIMEAALKT